MLVEVVPLTDFVHGSMRAKEGRPMPMPDVVASDLERAGLVRIRTKATAKVQPGKAVDDGRGQPSSASQAAPASRTTTLHLPKRGQGNPLKTEKSP